MAVCKSTVVQRARSATEIINLAKKQSDEAREILDHGNLFFNTMIAVCNKELPYRVKEVNLHEMPEVRTLLQQQMPLRIIVPIQDAFNLDLPRMKNKTGKHDVAFNPFSSSLPIIQGFAEKVLVMASAQKPRRIGIIGTDGKWYHFLCKPKDDLRKDARMMEFNTMINRLLKKNPQSRKRKLCKYEKRNIYFSRCSNICSDSTFR